MTSAKSAQLEQLGQLLELMRCLRDPENGCAWDRKQTWQSLCRHTLEEVYEVVDAIEEEGPEKVCDELGDLLFLDPQNNAVETWAQFRRSQKVKPQSNTPN